MTDSKIVVLVPAYSEEKGISATIRGLLAQDINLHKIVVIVNTAGSVLEDRTAEIARRFPGVVVEEMTHNQDKKSGAMNWGWHLHGRDADYIFTMDADTIVFPNTIRSMMMEFESDPKLGAVCARYWAQPGHGLAWRLQRIEYARYDDARDLRKWRVQVASGAAVMYRQEALVQVLRRQEKMAGAHRASGKHRVIDGEAPRYAPWDGKSLIEDYGLTLDLRSVGWKTRAARTAHVLTDTPKTFKDLWRQRLRWGRGGVDEVRKRGWRKYMAYDISGYGLFGVGVLGRLLFLTYLGMMIAYGMAYQFSLIGFIPLAVMWTARFTSYLRLNGKQWIDYLIVGSLVIEDVYGFFLEACALVSIFKSFRSTRQGW